MTSAAAPAAPSVPLVVALTGPGAGVLPRLATCLAATGAPVLLATPEGAVAGAAAIAAQGGRAVGVTSSLARRDELDAALARAAELGRLGTMVVVHYAPQALAPQPLDQLHASEWDTACEAPIRSCLVALQAAFAALAGTGGAIVVVVPTTSLVGAPNLVPLTTAAEAQRILAKSAARRWGRSGITVNVVALPVEAFLEGENTSPGDTGAFSGLAASLGTAALPDADWAAEAASLIAYLGAGTATGVTGATICVDAGVMMA